MSLWKKMKNSWKKEYNRPWDVYNIPCEVAWVVSLALLGIGFWSGTIKTYWWVALICLCVIGITDFAGDWCRKKYGPKLTSLDIVQLDYISRDKDD